MTDNEKRILAALERLSEEQQRQLVDYAEFLVGRTGGDPLAGAGEAVAGEPAAPREPQPVEPAPDEGPVKAIKRLRQTYPMLDATKLLDETTTIMSKRYLQDKPEDQVIEELEEVFEQHYRRYLAAFED
ncbi:MAG TPA: Crp/Fnr family transcriptional regulator [Gammaproteobacteria bacterium]|nr:Crp/Fnr family transcriptional regulator [Gammaproteobacteria bacterium]